MNSFISQLTAGTYQNIVKPIFFSFDAEAVHNMMVGMGKFSGEIPLVQDLFRTVYAYEHSSLRQKIAGIEFKNPIGLAAGFDYDANLTQILPDVGFGFHSVGTVTALPYEGNTPPRLGRLPKSRSLLVNKGYKSAGVDQIIHKLQKKEFRIPLGVSIGSTNKEFESSKEQIQDFIYSFEKVSKNLTRISYFELNISCPNLKTGEPFTTPKRLEPLLREVEKLKLKKPIFIKMPTDIGVTDSNALLKTADKYSIAGCIFGNLTKDRKNPDLDPEEVKQAGIGNFSGKPVEKRANNLLSAAYQEYGDRFTLIGCGGTFSAEDAYRKIKLGAHLVQMITGMIYQGPQVIGQINEGLVQLVQADGYESIAEAVGQDNPRKKKKSSRK